MKTAKVKEVVFFSPTDEAVAIRPGESVLELSEREDLGIPSSCGGMGSCGTCLIVVENDPMSLPERSEIEAEFASDRGFRECERLACQLEAFHGLRFRLTTDQE